SRRLDHDQARRVAHRWRPASARRARLHAADPRRADHAAGEQQSPADRHLRRELMMKATSMDKRSLVLRSALVLCGLVVLSLVGRFAVAGGLASPAAVGGSSEPALVIGSSSAPPLLVVAAAIADASAPPVAHSPHATEDDPVYLNDATVDDL